MGVKSEIKNLNSFRFLQKALEYETERHIELIEDGKPILQETRLWDSRQNKTLPMRNKEEAHDYRYFPEPDLPPLIISEDLVNEIKAALPELPHEKIERFVREYQIPPYDAKILISSRNLVDYFEQTAKVCKNPKQASNWIMREVLQYLKEANIEITQFPSPPENLGELILLVENKEVTLRVAKEKVFPEMLKSKKKAVDIVKEKGLGEISDEKKIREIILHTIEKNPGPLKQYLNGKVQVLSFFVGQVMEETRGSANPQLVNKLSKKILDGYK